MQIKEDKYELLEELDPKEKKYVSQTIDLENYIQSKVRMKNFRDFDPRVGVDGGHWIGMPGSGKSSFMGLIAKDLIKTRGENILLSADRFCEFRHYFRYPRFVKKITLFLPEKDTQELFLFRIPTKNDVIDKDLIFRKYNIKFDVLYVDFETFNINDYLTEETKGQIFAIYDQHFQGTFLWKRAELWKRVTLQLLERKVLLDGTAITTLFNEAGILWKEGASGRHWKEVNEYAEIVVECRKGLVRNMHASQLETEESYTIRKKLLYRCYRLGTTAGKGIPMPVQKATPFQSRSSYILCYGNLYSIGNQTPKMSEMNETWKIIPVGYPDISNPDDKGNKYLEQQITGMERMKDDGFTQREIGHYHGVSQQTAGKRLAKI